MRKFSLLPPDFGSHVAIIMTIAVIMLCLIVFGKKGHGLETRVVCEQSAFEDVQDPGDPYLRRRAVCNLNDSNGEEIPVFVID
jgi:hypothetical protein